MVWKLVCMQHQGYFLCIIDSWSVRIKMVLGWTIRTYLSRRTVHNSPPRQTSNNMYKYFRSLNVRYSLFQKVRTQFIIIATFFSIVQIMQVLTAITRTSIYKLEHNSGVFIWLYLTIKSDRDSDIIFFSFMICSCCLVSTMWCFLRILRAKVRELSLLTWTYNQSDI